jgi:hypothetical protein
MGFQICSFSWESGMSDQNQVTDRSAEAYARLHLRFGWWSLLIFISLGLVLEVFHGLKIGWYLQVSSHIRRLMLTLAHTHGTLLALVHLLFSLTACRSSPDSGSRARAEGESVKSPRWRRWASSCLIGASLLLPGGFFLGGFFIYDGDPGLGALLVPVGGVLLIVAIFLTARGVSSESS